MNFKPKYKIGDRVSVMLEGEKYTGKIVVIDNIDYKARYDIMCDKPKILLIKHVFEKHVIS